MSADNRRGASYTSQMLGATRDGIVRGASLSELSAIARVNALANPFVIPSKRVDTIKSLRDSNNVSPVSGASTTFVAATLAGDWLLAVTASLLIEDRAEREAALIMVQGNRRATETVVQDLACASDRSNTFYPLAVKFCCELTGRYSETNTAAALDSELLPRSLGHLVHTMVETLSTYPLDGRLAAICPPGSLSAECLEHVVSGGGTGADSLLNVLYAVLTTDDALATLANRKGILRSSELEVLGTSVDDSVWRHMRLLRAAAEFAAGNVGVARVLVSDMPEGDCLNALISIEAGELTEARNLAGRAVGSALSGAELVLALTDNLIEDFASPAGAGPGTRDEARSQSSLSDVHAWRGVAVKTASAEADVVAERSARPPRTMWADGGDSQRTVRDALLAIDRDRSAASQKELEALGDAADRLLQRPDGYRMLAKWLRLTQAERLYQRGRYRYSKRVYTYVKSLFMKTCAPDWVVDHIDVRLSALATLESPEFVL